VLNSQGSFAADPKRGPNICLKCTNPATKIVGYKVGAILIGRYCDKCIKSIEVTSK
jgi:hypothetical protein